MDRSDLIARKQEVRRQIERVNRQLDTENNAERAAADPRRDRRQIAQLEQQLQTLMAEEYALRLEIDRSE